MSRWPINRAWSPPPSPSRTLTMVSPSSSLWSIVTSAPIAVICVGEPPTDLVDAGLVIRAAVDVHESLQVRKVRGLLGRHERAQLVQLGVGDCGHWRTIAAASKPSERRPYTPATVRLVEIRLLDGPNIYRLEPAVKIEVAVGRRRTWYGAAPARKTRGCSARSACQSIGRAASRGRPGRLGAQPACQGSAQCACP